MTTVYLDACCLNRPFDDQSQARIRLEAEAVMLLFAYPECGDLHWIGSEVLSYEIGRMPDPERRRRVQRLLRLSARSVTIGPEQQKRAAELQTFGFGTYDALHLACAEQGGAELFLTTDDALVRLARRHISTFCVRVENPLTWVNKMVEP